MTAPILPHEDPDFGRLVLDVAASKGLDAGLVEKDYWVTHVLWALCRSGFEVRFKGGTCLSKGYGLIERFSEDLDLHLGPGTSRLPAEPSWKGERASHIAARRAWFEALASAMDVPGCTVAMNHDLHDERARSVVLEVRYPEVFTRRMAAVISPWVRLEVGVARTTPAVDCRITSWVHDELDLRNVWSGLIDNRPPPIHCVHPVVTLLEKIDAISRRWTRGDLAARAFVRHYEDAARIVEALPKLAPVPGGLDRLVAEMLEERHLRVKASMHDPAFVLAAGERTDELHAAWDAIAPLFFGPRVPLDVAAARIRRWIGTVPT